MTVCVCLTGNESHELGYIIIGGRKNRYRSFNNIHQSKHPLETCMFFVIGGKFGINNNLFRSAFFFVSKTFKYGSSVFGTDVAGGL